MRSRISTRCINVRQSVFYKGKKDIHQRVLIMRDHIKDYSLPQDRISAFEHWLDNERIGARICPYSTYSTLAIPYQTKRTLDIMYKTWQNNTYQIHDKELTKLITLNSTVYHTRTNYVFSKVSTYAPVYFLQMIWECPRTNYGNSC